MTSIPFLGLTMGDPAGIGPEVIVKAVLARERVAARLVVIGDVGAMERAVRAVGATLPVRSVADVAEAGRGGGLDVLQATDPKTPPVPFGQVDAAGGRAAYDSLALAIDLARAGKIDGIVTAPLNKKALNLAGFAYAGHTEILKALTQAPEVAMLLSSATLKIVHVTGHMSLQQALDRIDTGRIVRTARLGHAALRDMGVAQPRVAVAGINPHAGEQGLFGIEDGAIVAPAVTELQKAGIDASGPHPPDTVFTRANKGAFDLIVAMYHDQGHIPMKLVAFDSAVNITLGLPIVRTSPDHGTAFDIAGSGRADPRSMVEAIRLAAQLAGARRQVTNRAKEMSVP